MIYKNQKEIQTKLTKNLLDIIVLRLINHQSIHGYQVITKTRKIFGVYFGPSTVYPLLANLEKKGYIISEWNMTGDKPRKVFTITSSGKDRIKSSENTLGLICKTLNTLNFDAEQTEP
ncbi:MAG: PadR family transcriptional regulator [Nitrososphaerota archaeon]|nr:PadR family transcriptional regulator [Nitrososphaerota archaeon]